MFGQSYTAKLISYHKQFIDTIFETFFINDPKPLLGNDATFCNSFKLTLGSKAIYKTYKWNGGASTKTLTISRGGIYSLKVVDYDGCISSDTIIIKNPIIQAGFYISDTSQCQKSNVFKFKQTNTFKDDFLDKSVWHFSDGSSIDDTVAVKTFTHPGRYSVTLVSNSISGCKDSIIKKVRVYENTAIGYTINQAYQCLNNNNFEFRNTSVNLSDSVSYDWDLGDIKTSQIHITNKQYSKTGDYKISLIATTQNNCMDTLHKLVSILPSPQAEFNWLTNCSRTITQFNFGGTVPPKPINSSFHWYFPQNDSSNLENPAKLLNNPGINKVDLRVRSDNGCEDYLSKDVEILAQAKAQFDAEDVCEDSLVIFNNTSIDAISFNWRFGDGSKSTEKSPKHTYQIGGVSKTFNVSLAVHLPGGCSDSTIKSVTVNEKPVSNFDFTTSGRKVSFTALENTASKYEWTFGDGGTATLTNFKTSYDYLKFPSGKYTACLRVTNISDCYSQTCKEIQITGNVGSTKKQKGIKIFPNPNPGRFLMKVEADYGILLVFVYNQHGALVHTYKPNYTSGTHNFDIDLANGVYHLKIINGDKIYNESIIVSTQ